jgi:DNA polymerase V
VKGDTSLLDESETRAKSRRLMSDVDAVNTLYGRGTFRAGAAGFTQHWAVHSENRSPRNTTHWSELVHVQGVDFLVHLRSEYVS